MLRAELVELPAGVGIESGVLVEMAETLQLAEDERVDAADEVLDFFVPQRRGLVERQRFPGTKSGVETIGHQRTEVDVEP